MVFVSWLLMCGVYELVCGVYELVADVWCL